MSEKKTKISMFLEPELAKAVKIQAARQGGGVSEIMRSVLTCRHCHAPITDEFVISGTPVLVGPGKYDVFFHKNKPECRKASGERIAYVPKCPQCNEPAYQSFEREKLSELLSELLNLTKPLKFYCIRCGDSWPAAVEDIGKLSILLKDSE